MSYQVYKLSVLELDQILADRQTDRQTDRQDKTEGKPIVSSGVNTGTGLINYHMINESQHQQS
ncbi:hypothetical protein ACF0H5_006573 [Mactra antiquata]